MDRLRIRRTLATLISLAVIVTPLASISSTAGALQIAQPVVPSTDPANWTPGVQDGQVNALVQLGDRIFVGGTFTSVKNTSGNGGQTYTRQRVFALDADTGVVDTSFAPTVDGEVAALAVSPDGNLFIGGNFNTVNGSSRRGLAKLNPNNGSLVSGFTTVPNGRVRGLAINGTTLYMGGHFSKIGGVNRDRLGAINAVSGAVSSELNLPVTQSYTAGSARNVLKVDVTPSGDRLVVIGNFRVIGGQTRVQVAMIDLTTSPDTIAPWNTNAWDAGTCADRFKEYVRDVEFSPDGSYFAIASTGAGYWPQTLCDTLTRWPTYSTSSNVTPDWIDYTGGDTLFSVGVTGSAVYAGGHQRWMNGEAVGDQATAGAVSRPGISAHDPVNGVPYDWNPVRNPRGLGVFDFLATNDGLWFGSNTCGVAGEQHCRLAFFPSQGGHAPAVGQAPTLPADLYSMGSKSCSAVDTSIMYRVNTGGSALTSLDCGMDWQADTGTTHPNRNTGSNVATYSDVPNVAGSVPATTPRAVFSSERWDPGTAPEMEWNFPAASGTNLRVRLYFSDRCTCTTSTGSRVFDVSLEGTTVLDNFDINAQHGHDTGAMRSFDITSDGNVDIDFGHVTENPLINGIEIINLDVPGGPAPTASDALTLRAGFAGTAPVPAGSTVTTPGVDWTQARGAFYLNGSIYAGWSNGRLYGWTFNGSSLGAQRDLMAENAYVLGPSWLSFANVTGMYWEAGRLYYTRQGDSRLFYRYFSPDSEIVNSVQFVASGSGDGFNWSAVRGISYSSGSLLYVAADGSLHTVQTDSVGDPIFGTDTTIGGPGVDGVDYRSNGMFMID